MTLFWSKSANRISVEILDVRLGELVEFGVDNHVALDAFNHPYVYARQRLSTERPSSIDTRR